MEWISKNNYHIMKSKSCYLNQFKTIITCVEFRNRFPRIECEGVYQPSQSPPLAGTPLLEVYRLPHTPMSSGPSLHTVLLLCDSPPDFQPTPIIKFPSFLFFETKQTQTKLLPFPNFIPFDRVGPGLLD